MSQLQMGPPTEGVAAAETYGKGSRNYYRMVYTHNEWVKHRSLDCFTKNLLTIFNLGVYKSLAKEILSMTAMAAFVAG